MNKKRENPSNKTPPSQKKPKLNMSTTPKQSHSRLTLASSPDELPVNLISSSSNKDDTDPEEIPETPEGSPSSIISASPDSSLAANLIEDIVSPTSPVPLTSSSNQLEKSLINEIESDSSSSSDFDATALIESGSETTSQDHQARVKLPAALTQFSPRPQLRFVQPKDAVDIPLVKHPAKHPLTIITARPVQKNGLADELKKVLVEYRSKENLWQYDIKLGVAVDPSTTELVHVKSIKKFHSYCLLVEIDVQRGQGDATEFLLLNVNWDSMAGGGLGALQAGDKLIVNFRKTEPIRLNDKLLHFLPFVQPQ